VRGASKLAFLGVGVVAVLLLAGLPGLGQGVLEPAGELSDAECYGHHKQEGFRSFDLFPLLVSTVPKGQDFTFEMTIRNPWLHEVRDLVGYVDISNAPGLGLEGGKDPQEETRQERIDAGVQSTQRYTLRTYDINVEENATEIYVRVAGAPGTQVPAPHLRDRRADYDITLTSPDGASVVLTGPDPSPVDESIVAPGAQVFTWDEEVRVNQRNITAGGTGAWKLTVAYRGWDQVGEFTLFTGVYYNVTGLLFMPGPAVLQPNEAHKFTFNLRVKDVDGLQSMRYGGVGVAYHEHTDKNIDSDGNYDKWSTMTFETGATLVIAGSGEIAVGPGADTLGPVFRRWGQVLGFASAFLILPSLVFGGTLGKSSVVTLNKWFGGPRRRVLFHNTMSFWLLGLALLHMFLFLYEAFWNWSHGLVWGGLSLACMIGLGVTGATQRSFVAKWGFNRWRFVHFAMGILVAVFVLVHILADGSHLAPIRSAWFGGSSTDAGGINLG